LRTVALIVAGAGPADPESPGPLTPLAGRPLAAHSIAAFAVAPEVDELVLVAPPALAGELGAARVVEAAGSWAESVSRAIEVLGEPECNLLIHDAARPLIGPRVIADCAAALRTGPAVCAAVPASDTMVAVAGHFISARPDRSRLRRREYPQGFHLPVIRRAYRSALADPHYQPTDDCGVVLRYLPEVTVRLVPGSGQGFPVTSPLDLEIAETILRAGQLSA
jgi:2-C-methyl-D-erythritol 4-phosphate cytidylyltransferase